MRAIPLLPLPIISSRGRIYMIPQMQLQWIQSPSDAKGNGKEDNLMNKTDLPLKIFSGNWKTSHVQGIAVDTARQYIYYSFTTMLLKTDLQGHLIGWVDGLTGHLGCLDFNDRDGRVYGSLEYKAEKAFYIAIFDVDKITGPGMNAETDGIMTTVYLKDVVSDYTADMDGNGVFDGDVAQTPDHRYGCSGIDGVAFGPQFGDFKGSDSFLHVAYGIYSNIERDDNDYQVILRYDTADWKKYEQPLNQKKPHTSGPQTADGRYFLFTGNTTYGIQNLEYDGFTGHWFVTVYEGKKAKYKNFPMFIIDGSIAPVEGVIKGQATEETGMLLSLLEKGEYDAAAQTYGWRFAYGQTGMFSFDDGTWFISHNDVTLDGRQNSTVCLYRWTGQTPYGFEMVE